MANDSNEEATRAGQDLDPIADRSLSVPMLILSGLLFVSLVWALYDELFAERPWKNYQRQFVSLYTSYLKKLEPKQAATDKTVRNSPEFQKIDQQVKAAEGAVAAKVRE